MIISFNPLYCHHFNSTYAKYFSIKKRIVVRSKEFPINYKETGRAVFHGEIISDIDRGKNYIFNIYELSDIKIHKDLETFE